MGKKRDTDDLWDDATQLFPAFQGHIHWVVTHHHDPFIADYYIFVSTMHQTVIKRAQIMSPASFPVLHERKEPCGKMRSWRHILQGRTEKAKKTMEFEHYLCHPCKSLKPFSFQTCCPPTWFVDCRGGREMPDWLGCLCGWQGKNRRFLMEIFRTVYLSFLTLVKAQSYLCLHELQWRFWSDSGGLLLQTLGWSLVTFKEYKTPK